MGARDEPEVLVSPDEEELLRRFYAAAERPLRHARAIVSEERELTPKLLVIDRIELAELKIESIEQPSGLSR